MSKLLNPLTGNWIQRGGATHQKLIASEILSDDFEQCQKDAQSQVAKLYCRTLIKNQIHRPISTHINQPQLDTMLTSFVPPKPINIPIIKNQSQLFDTKINQLNFKLLGLNQVGQKSIVMSPLSIYSAMLMVYFGAQGQTQTELGQLLGLLPKDDALYISKIDSLINLSQKESAQVKFMNSNLLLINHTYPVEKNYRDLFQDVLGGRILTFNQPDKAIIETNQWVKNKTAGLISKIVDENIISASTQIIIVNAVYFKAQWQIPFKSENTRPDYFQHRNNQLKVPFMNHEDRNYRYFEDKQCQYLELLYTDPQFGFRVALPKDNRPSQLTLENMTRTLASLKDVKFQPNFVSVSMPKFTHRYKSNLVDNIRQLGVKSVFTSGADLSMISKRNNLVVSGIIHEAVVKIDEAGTEAAAVTVVIMKSMAMMKIDKPIEFKANRPFYYEIVYLPRQLILFSGVFIGNSDQ